MKDGFRIIKLTKDQIKAVKPMNESNNSAIVAFYEASKWMKESHKTLWDQINVIIPESKDHRCGYDSKKNEIIIYQDTD